jgi:transcriptional regulator NrdR family protein
VEDKQLLSQLKKITDQLKTIADNLGVSVGVTAKGGAPKIKNFLSGEEKIKIRLTAEETAKTYRTVLGLGIFNRDIVDRTADRFRDVLGITSFFNKLTDTFDKIKTYIIQTSSNTKPIQVSLKDKIDLSILEKYFITSEDIQSKVLKELENLNNLEKYFITSEDIQSKVLKELENLNNTAFYTYDILNKDKKNKDVVNQLNRLGVSMASRPSTNYNTILNSIRNTLNVIRTNLIGRLSSIKLTIPEIKSKYNILKNILKWDSYKDDVLYYLSELHISMYEMSKNIQQLVGLNETIIRQNKINNLDKTDTKGGILDRLSSITGLMLLGGAMTLIISALVKSNFINVGQTLKVLAIIAGMATTFLLFAKFGTSAAKNAAIGFSILSGTVLLIILPMIYGLSKIPLAIIAEGLAKFSLIVGVCIGLLNLMGRFTRSKVKDVSIGLLFLLGSVIVSIGLLKIISNVAFDIILLGLFKMGIIFTVLYGVLKLIQKTQIREVIFTGLVIGALSMLFRFALFPMLDDIARRDFVTILKGLTLMGLSIIGLTKVLQIASNMIKNNAVELVAGGATILALSFVLSYMADSLQKFADPKKWMLASVGLIAASAAMTLFGGLVALVGVIALEAAPFLAGGAAVLIGLSFVMGFVANGLKKFQDIDAGQITKVGGAMVILSTGLLTFLGGSIAGAASGILNGLFSFFGLDPASQIKKFEKLDADKLEKVGLSLLNISKGLKELSSGIDLKNITDQVIGLIKPFESFTGALDKFSGAYEKLNKVKLQVGYNFNIDNNTGIQEAIKELHQQELKIQQAQLSQLQENGNYLRIISEKIHGDSRGNSFYGDLSKNEEKLYTPNFSTKENYINNMKLTTMSFQA